MANIDYAGQKLSQAVRSMASDDRTLSVWFNATSHWRSWSTGSMATERVRVRLPPTGSGILGDSWPAVC